MNGPVRGSFFSKRGMASEAMKKILPLLLGTVGVILMTSCDLLGQSSPTNTAVPALTALPATPTAGPLSTQAAVLATGTPAPSLTPTATSGVSASPTVTLTPFLGAAAGDLDCKLLSQSVRNGAHFAPTERFSIGWKVRNSGTLTWDAGSVYFAYFSGSRMDREDLYALPETVDPGNTVALSASMAAPKRPGGYTTTWALRRGDNRFCRVSLTINVP